jgi:hypothetical protein
MDPFRKGSTDIVPTPVLQLLHSPSGTVHRDHSVVTAAAPSRALRVHIRPRVWRDIGRGSDTLPVTRFQKRLRNCSTLVRYCHHSPLP